MPVEPAELAELLELLLDASVEFILVGGGAAVIHGAPVTTQDIDIVHRREAENVDRLLQVLSRLDARLVDPAGRDLAPEDATLSGPGQSLIRTRLGRIDAWLASERRSSEGRRRSSEVRDAGRSVANDHIN